MSTGSDLELSEIYALSREEVGARICPGQPVDPGIAVEVAILGLGGVETYESCQGGEGHAYSRRSIRFHGPPAAGWHALSVALYHGLPVRQLSRVWSVTTDGEPDGPTWEMTFRDLPPPTPPVPVDRD